MPAVIVAFGDVPADDYDLTEVRAAIGDVIERAQRLEPEPRVAGEQDLPHRELLSLQVSRRQSTGFDPPS
jgi:hypothetical protein